MRGAPPTVARRRPRHGGSRPTAERLLDNETGAQGRKDWAARESDSCRGSGTSAKLEGQERFSSHFFPCNALGLMLNFAKVGGAAAASAAAVPGPLDS